MLDPLVVLEKASKKREDMQGIYEGIARVFYFLTSSMQPCPSLHVPDCLVTPEPRFLQAGVVLFPLVWHGLEEQAGVERAVSAAQVIHGRNFKQI